MQRRHLVRKLPPESVRQFIAKEDAPLRVAICSYRHVQRREKCASAVSGQGGGRSPVPGCSALVIARNSHARQSLTKRLGRGFNVLTLSRAPQHLGPFVPNHKRDESKREGGPVRMADCSKHCARDQRERRHDSGRRAKLHSVTVVAEALSAMRASMSQVSTAASGLSESDSMPRSTSHAARSG